jgi:hypothetical protein
LILRPDVTVERDALTLAGLYVVLIAAGVLFWITSLPSDPFSKLLGEWLIIPAMVGFGLPLTWLTARLFWKIRSLNQNEP